MDKKMNPAASWQPEWVVQGSVPQDVHILANIPFCTAAVARVQDQQPNIPMLGAPSYMPVANGTSLSPKPLTLEEAKTQLTGWARHQINHLVGLMLGYSPLILHAASEAMTEEQVEHSSESALNPSNEEG